jgi:hypothetical protein
MKNKMEKATDIKREEQFAGKHPKEVFTEVFTINDWSSTESHSGMGSTLQYTTNTRKGLPLIWSKYNIKKVLDIGCGDFNWMKDTKKKVRLNLKLVILQKVVIMKELSLTL